MTPLLLLLSLALVPAVLCQDATTTVKVHHTHVHHSHSPRPSVEPSEHEAYVFRYDGRIHEMVIRNGQTCYLMPLTDVQKAKVHDPVGIKSIEATALGLIADTSVQTTVDASSLARYTINHDCQKVTKVISLQQN